ncbi:hypothetical protein BGZ80_007450, partial [Entomortierella chlamydospora]
MEKKVLRTKEHDNKVTIYSENTEYECHILVGADGAYSAVRQSKYEALEEQISLPLVNKEALGNPPDPEKSYWGFQIQIPENTVKDLHFRNFEWRSEPIDNM